MRTLEGVAVSQEVWRAAHGRSPAAKRALQAYYSRLAGSNRRSAAVAAEIAGGRISAFYFYARAEDIARKDAERALRFLQTGLRFAPDTIEFNELQPSGVGTADEQIVEILERLRSASRHGWLQPLERLDALEHKRVIAGHQAAIRRSWKTYRPTLMRLANLMEMQDTTVKTYRRRNHRRLPNVSGMRPRQSHSRRRVRATRATAAHGPPRRKPRDGDDRHVARRERVLPRPPLLLEGGGGE